MASTAVTLTIQDFYKEVLTALRFRVDENNLISHLNIDGSAYPTLIEEKRLMLPTKEALKEGISNDLQPFHPLSESIARKAISPVQRRLKKQAAYNLAAAFTEWSSRLIRVAADTSLQKDLPPSCSEYLKKVPKADQKCVEAFDTLIEKAASKQQLITVYLKNGGVYQGKKVNRLCVIRFPVMDVLDSGEEKPFGVKLSKKERETISAVLHHVMPFGSDPEEYSAGSDSRVAPFFDAFLRAYGKAAAQLNKINKKYGKAIALDRPLFDLSYLEHMDEMASLYDSLPAMKGNQGELDEEDEAVAAKTATPAEPGKVVGSVQHRAAKAAEPVAKSHGLSMREFLSAMRPQQPVMPPQPPQGYQQPYGHAPVYPQQPTPQPAGYGYNQPYPAYNAYSAQPAQDPLRPSWLVGGGQPVAPAAPQNPFATALRSPQPTPAQPTGYGATGYATGHYGGYGGL